MPSTGSGEARRSSISYDAAVTLDQSGPCTGRQAEAHSRGNDTALLLWERLTEHDGMQRGRGQLSPGASLISLCCCTWSVCRFLVFGFPIRFLWKVLRSYDLFLWRVPAWVFGPERIQNFFIYLFIYSFIFWTGYINTDNFPGVRVCLQLCACLHILRGDYKF